MRAVLIMVLHVDGGCWLGQLGLVRPVVQMRDAGC